MIMLTTQRSVLTFIVIIAFGVGSAIFVIKKGNDAAKEIQRLKSGVPTAHRIALTGLLGDELEKNTVNISNWKTYRNEKYGFEMRYPMEWIHGFDNPVAAGRHNFTHIRLQTDLARSISIQVIPAESVSSLPYYVGEQNISKVASRMSGNYEILELSGMQAIKFLGSVGGFIIFHRNPNFEIYINDTSKVAERGNYLPVDADVIERIVSTFKFIK